MTSYQLISLKKFPPCCQTARYKEGFFQDREIPKDFTMSQLQPTRYKGGIFSRGEFFKDISCIVKSQAVEPAGPGTNHRH